MVYQQRTSGVQLPSVEELIDILRKESPRQALRFDYIQKNQEIFASHHKVSQLAKCNDSWINNYSHLSLIELINRIVENHTLMRDYISENSNKLLYQQLYQSLVPQLDESTSEALFVFGAASNARIERAVGLFKDGVSNYIIISGQGPHYAVSDISEARRMAMYADQHGVPANALILEEKAITIADNVKRTIDLLIRLDIQPRSMTIIATDFVLRRAMMDWYKFAPWPINIKPIAAHSQSTKFTPKGWTKQPDTIALVLNEYAKLILETKIDLLRHEGKISI